MVKYFESELTFWKNHFADNQLRSVFKNKRIPKQIKTIYTFLKVYNSAHIIFKYSKLKLIVYYYKSEHNTLLGAHRPKRTTIILFVVQTIKNAATSYF